MTGPQESYTRSVSTTWTWKKVKMSKPPQALGKTAPKATIPGLGEWDPRDRLSLQITHRGGAESWWEIRARGRVWRVPGHLCLEDVMAMIHQGRGGKRPQDS